MWNYGEYKGVVGNTTWELLFSEKAKGTSAEYKTMWIQKRLKELGYKGKDGRELAIDGSYGQNSYSAVNDFKNQNGLRNDGAYRGVVDDTTWDYLFSDKAAKAKVQKTVNNITNKTITQIKSPAQYSHVLEDMKGSSSQYVAKVSSSSNINLRHRQTEVNAVERINQMNIAPGHKARLISNMNLANDVHDSAPAMLRFTPVDVLLDWYEVKSGVDAFTGKPLTEDHMNISLASAMMSALMVDVFDDM